MTDHATTFRMAHIPGKPLILFNIWDAGSAAALRDAGAVAIATGSWSVAAAQGYPDGQALPMADLLHCARRIAAAVDLPLSVDFEGGYATDPDDLAQNVMQLRDTGAVGLNFEDQIIGGTGLHACAAQTDRIAAIKAAIGEDMFLNARIDLFLQTDAADHHAHMSEAIARAQAYHEAGADGVFLPGLVDLDLIGQACAAISAPVNVMATPQGPDIPALAKAGVARISHGPGPYRAMIAWLGQVAAV